MNNRFFEKSSQELRTKSRNCSITYERKKKEDDKKEILRESSQDTENSQYVDGSYQLDFLILESIWFYQYWCAHFVFLLILIL
jgi:hypothetical protein